MKIFSLINCFSRSPVIISEADLFVTILFLFLLSVAGWLPFLLFPISMMCLLVASKLITKDAKTILATTMPFALFAMAITILGEPTLRYADSDFVAYYNNYLSFLIEREVSSSTSAHWGGAPWGGGVEVGIPSLHFIFSKIIQAPAPFVVKLFHAILLESLLVCILFQISTKLKLKIQDFVILICFVFVFIKFSGMFNHLRQSYSSLIIILALFSDSKFKRKLLVLCACTFHLSTLVVYPLCNWLFYSRVKYKMVMIFSVFFAAVIIVLMPFLVDLVAAQFKNSLILSKIIWSLFRSQEENSVLNSLITTLTRLMYLLPIIILAIATKKIKTDGFLISLFVFIIVLSFYFLPGFAVRIFQIFLMVMVGYLYFASFNKRTYRSPLVYSILIFFLFVHTILWLRNSFYFYELPLISSEPFEYLSVITEERYIINRQSLPTIETFIRRIDN